MNQDINNITIPPNSNLTDTIPATRTIMLYNRNRKVDQFINFDILSLPSCPSKIIANLITYVYGGVMDGQAIYNEERQ